MNRLIDYRKTLAVIAPPILGPGAEVWLSDVGFERFLRVLGDIIALDVHVEIDRVSEVDGRISVDYRALGPDADKVEQLIAALSS